MRTISKYFFLVALICPAISNAEESMLKAGSKSIAFSINEDIEVRGSYFLNPNWSWLIGIGYLQTKIESDYSLVGRSDGKFKTYILSTGARYYFYKEEVNFFTEGLVSYRHSEIDSSGFTQKGTGIELNIGVEYFIAKPLSLSGTVGFNYLNSKEEGDGSLVFKQRDFGSLQSAVQINFYF